MEGRRNNNPFGHKAINTEEPPTNTNKLRGESQQENNTTAPIKGSEVNRFQNQGNVMQNNNNNNNSKNQNQEYLEAQQYETISQFNANKNYLRTTVERFINLYLHLDYH